MKKLIFIIIFIFFISVNNQAGAEKTNDVSTEDQIKKVYDFLISSEKEIDQVKAIDFLNKSSEQNNPIANYYLAMAYNNGTGVEKNADRAFLLLHKSSVDGYKRSQAELCKFYYLGIGTEINIDTAKKYCLLSAEQNWALGQRRLAHLYELEEDYSKATYWYEKAADNEDIDSQRIIGFYYITGKKIRKNMKSGVFWLERASLNGDSEAAFYVARMHYEGTLIPKNFKRAANIYRMAAKNNHVQAQLNYGLMLWKGEGVSKNLMAAYKWMTIVKSSGCKSAVIATKYARKLKKSISSQQRQIAEKLAKEWKSPQDLICETDK